MIFLSVTWPTRQPWWVQMAEKALKCPALGWVTTTCWSLRIVPPPVGTSAAATVAFEDPDDPDPDEPDPDDPDREPDEEGSALPPPPHAASSGRVTPPTAAPRSIVRRETSFSPRSPLGVTPDSVMSIPPVER
jgi:hypothetical protein